MDRFCRKTGCELPIIENCIRVRIDWRYGLGSSSLDRVSLPIMDCCSSLSLEEERQPWYCVERDNFVYFEYRSN
jgi:hypothetical protein